MSIERKLLLLLISIITLVSFYAALTGYQSAMAEANRVFDLKLKVIAHTIADLNLEKPFPDNHHDSLAFQIWQDNTLVSKNDNAPDFSISQEPTGYGENNFNHQRWRTYSEWMEASQRQVMVAEPMAERISLAEKMAISNMSPLVYATLLLGILISVTIRTGLKPLKELSSRLKSREVTDFDPINLADCPDELIPIQQTINRSLKQVESLLLREKRFSSDAAHELRTPISNLKVRMHNLMTNHKDMSGELKQFETGVDRLSHVVEQILTLNRTHIDNVTQQFLPLDLDTLCQKVIMELYEQIEARHHSIELIAEPSFISGNMFALHSMISNLITNAVKYTPAGGQINITVKRQRSDVILILSDSGPGIPESEYIRITDRFYRVHGDQNDSDVIGCGLGMSIIKQVVDLHDGTILFDRDEGLGGLKVTLIFPATKDRQLT